MDAASAAAALLTSEGRRDPYPTYALLHRHGPLVTAGQYTIVSGYRAADQLLRDPRMVVLPDDLRDLHWPGWRENRAISTIAISMLRANPPDHTRMRRLVAGAFTARRVAAMCDVVAAQTAALLDEILEQGQGGRPVDFMAEFAYRLPVGVICALLGIPAADTPWFRQRATDLTAALELVADPDELAWPAGAPPSWSGTSPTSSSTAARIPARTSPPLWCRPMTPAPTSSPATSCWPT